MDDLPNSRNSWVIKIPTELSDLFSIVNFGTSKNVFYFLILNFELTSLGYVTKQKGSIILKFVSVSIYVSINFNVIITMFRLWKKGSLST